MNLIFRMETLFGSNLSVGPVTLINRKDNLEEYAEQKRDEEEPVGPMTLKNKINKLEEYADQKREGDKPGSLIVSNIPSLLTNKVIIYSKLYLLTMQGKINLIFLQFLFLLGSGEG